MLGSNTLPIHDGEVFGKTGSGTDTFALHDKAGKPVLILDVVQTDGTHYYLEMT